MSLTDGEPEGFEEEIIDEPQNGTNEEPEKPIELTIDQYRDAVDSLTSQIIGQLATIPGSICLDGLTSALSFVIAAHPDPEERENAIAVISKSIPTQVDLFVTKHFAPKKDEDETPSI